MIEMAVADILVRVSADDPMQLAWFGRIIVLKEKDGERALPIWTGPPEGDLLFMSLQGTPTPRPMPHDLMAELISVLRARVERVAITSRSEVALHATVALAVDGRTKNVDARPSDAILLAVRTGAPVLIDEVILNEDGIRAEALNEKLPPREVQTEVMAPGEWRSLSTELLQSLHRSPKQK